MQKNEHFQINNLKKALLQANQNNSLLNRKNKNLQQVIRERDTEMEKLKRELQQKENELRMFKRKSGQ